MSDVTPPQAGWYADPENPASERWWNGSGWSDHQRVATESPMRAPVEADPVASAAVAPVAVPAPIPDPMGFTFGSPAPAGSDRPDPYAPPVPASAQPYYGVPNVAAPYGAPPYGAPAYGAPAYGAVTNGLALGGLIASAVGWLVIPVLGSVAGIILSAFGLATARQREAAGNPNSGRGLAMAGIVVGIIVVVLQVIFYVLIFGAFFTTTTYLP